ncbi:carbohydrate ABC transporter permease [Breznakiella homolactica]|uniref:Sugar ABC transporter permease n=1 Tax=Breznakiella homolactica TaxID=2798577 RepID=A0A7T7XLI5_9SPIR|nr:sugar ABC transporter permease [Breznakiella homolactica]QQO08453.1 sugar ABC transporter permease [Breznakiella homolactica]
MSGPSPYALNRSQRFKRKLEPFLYLLPAILFFGLFTYYPFINTTINSFFLVDSMGRIKAPVGFENYIRVLTNPKFLQAIKNTFLYAFMAAPLSIFIALLLALVANRRRLASSVYETLFSLTMAMSMSVSAMIFRLAYNPTIGAVNYLLNTRINWLNDDRYAMVAISVISVWMNIGYNFLFLLAGIRGISSEVLESAELDGTSLFKRTVHIILPMISPTLFFLICTALAKSMMMSGLVLIFTNSGSIATTANVETMISFMYKQAVNNLNYNDAYAAAMIAFAITFILILISFRFEKKGVYYK